MIKNFFYLLVFLLASCGINKKIVKNEIVKIDKDTTLSIVDSIDKKSFTDTNINKSSKNTYKYEEPIDLMSSSKINNDINIETQKVDPKIPEPQNKHVKFSNKNNLNSKEQKSTIEINEGKLIYSVPDTMKLGNIYTIIIRIKKNTNNVKIIDSLYNQKIVDIKVTNSMEVSVIDPSPNESKSFNILKQNSDKQLIDDEDYTQWVYSVQPLKSGNLKLSIIVSIIKNDNKKEIVYFNNTYVKSNSVVIVKTFWEKYWQWLFSTIILPFIIFIYRNITKNKEN